MSPEPPQQNPLETIKGKIEHETIREFKRRVFSNVNELENLRDWLGTPGAQGVARALVLWALGRHNEAVPLLDDMSDIPEPEL